MGSCSTNAHATQCRHPPGVKVRFDLRAGVLCVIQTQQHTSKLPYVVTVSSIGSANLDMCP